MPVFCFEGKYIKIEQWLHTFVLQMGNEVLFEMKMD